MASFTANIILSIHVAIAYRIAVSCISYVFEKTCQQYKDYKPAGKRIFDSYVGSFINAFITTATSIRLIYMHHSVEDIEIFVCVFTGYFFYDLVSSFGYSLSTIDIIHHVSTLIPCIGYLYIENKVVHSYFVPYITLVELSTYFYDIRWFLYNLDLHVVFPRFNTLISLVFVVTFAFTRIIVLPMVVFLSFMNEYINDGGVVMSIMFSGLWVLCITQVYWFIKIVSKILLHN